MVLVGQHGELFRKTAFEERVRVRGIFKEANHHEHIQRFDENVESIVGDDVQVVLRVVHLLQLHRFFGGQKIEQNSVHHFYLLSSGFIVLLLLLLRHIKLDPIMIQNLSERWRYRFCATHLEAARRLTCEGENRSSGFGSSILRTKSSKDASCRGLHGTCRDGVARLNGLSGAISASNETKGDFILSVQNSCWQLPSPQPFLVSAVSALQPHTSQSSNGIAARHTASQEHPP